MKAALIAAAAATTAVLSTEVSYQGGQGNEVDRGGAFMDLENARAMGDVSLQQSAAYSKLKAESKLKGAAVTNNEFAFFLKGEKNRCH